ncbi:hypothetical protein SERLA73DRAFT_178992 [Serpula lacrymans var. lacrymans S7.3]|uniref:Transmembrane protein 188 n=2 Tax=Serpula lacrymans var. lacrymans TaxID=341189 RepID=F8PTF1_SERL3|nr:uncharacterized protein SERLADRAFT_463833 [Serpula lacrymans var. lacrymans S7.9]EGO00979.1 hypothetical protein SERLA73DRAFT_178992 [Serpula lacrymans var. lacrymans S7.3]EGO26615.1 hypothetical protein SERLADRAFT_463833 [Serpula lacrymans var. lacrymans S7.9]
MARRPTPPHSKTSFHPPNDPATYRDLLLFEERLKTNAANLQRRKSRYQLFLGQLILVIGFLLSEVLLQTAFLTMPYKLVLQKALPEIYTVDKEVTPHPHLASGLLFVSVTTLVLFFASGMYSEKIAYANRYVPHANKALRNFNMYLNMRTPSLRSKISFNPLSFLFPRPAPIPPDSGSRQHSPTRANVERNSSIPISPIPPSSNPRGELIFSSRVDRPFRESYERYRSAFERKRDERERTAASKTWIGWIRLKMPWNKGYPPPAMYPAGTTPLRTPSSSLRGRASGSSGPTPTSSRRSSPMPGSSRSRTPPTRPPFPGGARNEGRGSE